MLVEHENFSWFSEKEAEGIENPSKSGYPFLWGTAVFEDPHVIIEIDEKHSEEEIHKYAIGRPIGYAEDIVLTVRFTERDLIHIFGCDYWRKGRKLYERRIKEKDRAEEI